MKISYRPGKEPVSLKEIENGIEIDGEPYVFPTDCGDFPNVMEQTGGVISFATVIDGELHIIIQRDFDKKNMWENCNFLLGGGYRGSRYETIEEAKEYDKGLDLWL